MQTNFLSHIKVEWFLKWTTLGLAVRLTHTLSNMANIRSNISSNTCNSLICQVFLPVQLPCLVEGPSSLFRNRRKASGIIGMREAPMGSTTTTALQDLSDS